jgi:hypothetical protein
LATTPDPFFRNTAFLGAVRGDITRLTRRNCNEKNALHRGGEKNP